MGELVQARVGVLGHTEWIDLAVLERLPRPGELVAASEAWEEAAGGGAIAAVQMLKLTGSALLFTALSEDWRGERSAEELAARGVVVRAGARSEPSRRGLVYLTADGERTITVLGERLVAHAADPLPWEELAALDGVYVTGGDAGALAAARRARVVVATPRAGEALRDADVEVDVLVHSGSDAGETVDAGALDPPPRTIVTTLGKRGGRWEGAAGKGEWATEPLPGPRADAYGAGDSFAAGLTTGLAAGLPIAEAVRLGARCGAACMTGRGPYAGQLDLR